MGWQGCDHGVSSYAPWFKGPANSRSWETGATCEQQSPGTSPGLQCKLQSWGIGES